MELRVIAKIIGRSIGSLALVGALVVVLGETYMRIPWITQRLEYDIDPEVGGIVRPGQRGYIWMANMSFQSPPITVNLDGFRGEETRWNRSTIIGLGSSEAWGAGVEDDEVWSAILESRIRDVADRETVQVVNAGNPGFGPYQQSVVLRRILESHEVDGVIVRVSYGDRFFQPRTAQQLEAEMRSARKRKTLRRITKFIPFLVNKGEAQLPAIRRALRPWFYPTDRHAVPEPDPQQFWRAQHNWWQDIVDQAADRQVPVLFMIQDPFDLPDNDIVEQGLRETCRGLRDCAVYRMGGAAYGLDPDAGDPHRQFSRTMTLVRDAHANAAQHERVADALWGFLSARAWPTRGSLGLAPGIHEFESDEALSDPSPSTGDR